MKCQTLFESELDEEFLRTFPKDKRPVTKSRLLSGNFLISTGKEKRFFLHFFELHDHYIFLRKSPESEELAYMDIQNAFLKLTVGTMINGEPHFGIKFIKKRAYEELFTTNEVAATEWFEALKRYCVLTKFRLAYETIKVIGKGNFAKVFLVQRKTDKKQFAVKVFSKSYILADDAERRCLLYEIKMMREVNFYRVLKLVELYEGENYIYCLCELYPGTDLLNAIVKKGSQPEAKALTIILQILEALHYLHSKKIMHRDIKPENIIFKGTQDNIDIGVVDLGFATFEEDYRKLFIRCGTPGYVAPEILNDREYDCKVDIFSAGVIFYMMCPNQSDRPHPLRRLLLQTNRAQEHQGGGQLRLQQAGTQPVKAQWPH